MLLLRLTVLSILLSIAWTQREIYRRRECTSNNDPHINNFFGQAFEWQKAGLYCLHENMLMQVSAIYERCSSSWPTATCNCAVFVSVKGVQMASLYGCGSSTISTNPIYLANPPPQASSTYVCQPVGAGSPSLDSFWTSILPTAPGSQFKCVFQTSTATTWIRTAVNPLYDVIVGISTNMNSLTVYSAVTQNNTCDCLCDPKSNKIPPRDVVPEIEATCRDELVGALKIFDQFLDEARIKAIQFFVENCAIDIKLLKGDRLNLGAFQQGEVEKQYLFGLIEKFGQDGVKDVLGKYGCSICENTRICNGKAITCKVDTLIDDLLIDDTLIVKGV